MAARKPRTSKCATAEADSLARWLSCQPEADGHPISLLKIDKKRERANQIIIKGTICSLFLSFLIKEMALGISSFLFLLTVGSSLGFFIKKKKNQENMSPQI